MRKILETSIEIALFLGLRENQRPLESSSGRHFKRIHVIIVNVHVSIIKYFYTYVLFL